MNFRSLEYYVAIVKHGSISAAARELFISQQALSDCLSKLEQEVGTQLIKRSKPLQTTAAGTIMLESATNLIRGRNKMLKEIQRVIDNEKKMIYVSEVGIELSSVFPSIISSFCTEHPGYEIVIKTVAPTNLEGDFDNSFLFLNTASGKFPKIHEFTRINLLNSAQYAVVVHKNLLKNLWGNLPDDISELTGRTYDLSLFRDLPFVMRKDIAGNDDAKTRHLFDLSGFEPKIVFRSERHGLLFDMCIHGIGAYIGPYFQCKTVLNERGKVDNTNEMVLLLVEIPSASRIELDVCYRIDRNLSEAEKSFLSLIQRFFSNISSPQLVNDPSEERDV